MDRPRTSNGLTTSNLSIPFLTGFLIAIFASQWWQSAHYPFVLWVFFAGLGGISLVVGIMARTRTITQAGVFLLGCLLAIATVARTTHVPDVHTVDAYVPMKNAVITGIISDAPDKREKMILYTVATESLSANGQTVAVSGHVLVTDFGL